MGRKLYAAIAAKISLSWEDRKDNSVISHMAQQFSTSVMGADP